MRKIFILAFKELSTQFRTPMAYIILGLTLSVFHLFFFIIIDQNQEAMLRDIFRIMEFLFVFLIPLMTMKLISEECFSGTMEFLKTTPTTNTAIILGKYLGVLLFYSLIICATFIYAFILAYFSKPDRIAMGVGYFGIWLEGAFFLSIGLMTSSWTRNQILAAVTSYCFILSLYFSITIMKYIPQNFQGVASYIGCIKHLENFSVGILSSVDIIYYLSGICFCLMMSRLSIEYSLWR